MNEYNNGIPYPLFVISILISVIHQGLYELVLQS
jgi:hypothetical protein